MRIVTNNKNNRLQELKVFLLNEKMLLSSAVLRIITINFLSTNLKLALRALQIENVKKHLMAKKSLLCDKQRNEEMCYTNEIRK